MLTARTERTIYLRVLAPLLLAVLTLVIVSAGGFHALSGARAYVGGESLWSKAASQTVARLRARLTATTTTERCAPLTDWLEIPLGDRAARLELDKLDPDFDIVRQGFVRGGNSPDDVDAMIHLYRNFSTLPLLRDSVEAWRHGDDLIAQLRTLGESICARPAGGGDETVRADSLAALERLDADLLAAEGRFSATLGQASRRAEQLLSTTIVLLATLLVGGSVWYAMRSLRAQLAQRRALEEANDRWELVAEAAGIGVFVWRPVDDSLELDARSRRLYGLAPDAAGLMPRADVAQRMHPEDRDGVSAVTRSAIDGQTMRTRYRILMPNGDVRHLEATGSLRDPSAPPAQRRMFGVLRDVTDEITATRLLHEKDAAERVARARNEFLSRLSHELRTPLNAVLGLAQVLEVDTVEPLKPLQRQRVEMILQGGWQLLHLVDDVLDITSIDAGTLAIRPTPVELRAVLRPSLALIEAERAAFDIQIDDRWPAQTAQVMVDPKRLQQIFVNLLSNACKYNSRGGRLVLGYREVAREVALSFADQGRGLAPEQILQLFQPFKRLGTTADVPGTGLGLVVVKLLCEQMGGRVDVQSTPGEGACFTVWLPKA